MDLRASIISLLGYVLQCFLHIYSHYLSINAYSFDENANLKCEDLSWSHKRYTSHNCCIGVLQHGRHWELYVNPVNIRISSEVQHPTRRVTNLSISAVNIHPTIRLTRKSKSYNLQCYTDPLCPTLWLLFPSYIEISYKYHMHRFRRFFAGS